MKNKHSKRNRQQQPSTTPTNTALHLLPTPRPSQQYLTSPFPTWIERTAFHQPWAPVLCVGVAHSTYLKQNDPIFLTTTIIIAISAGLFRLWLNRLPNILAFTQEQLSQPAPQATELISSLHIKLTSRERLLLPLAAVAFSYLFLAKFLENQTTPIKVSWLTVIGLWAWLIGAAGHIALSVAKLCRALGRTGKIKIIPDHPDNCGGLEPLGHFFAWLASPLIIILIYLSLAASNPTLSPLQREIYTNIKQSLNSTPNPLLHTIKEISSIPQTIKEHRTHDAIEAELREASIARLKNKCAELDVPPSNWAHHSCVRQVQNESLDNGHHPRETTLLHEDVVLFSRLGLLILFPFTTLCLAWPLADIHRTMVTQRDQHERAMATGMHEASLRATDELKKGNTAEAVALTQHIEELQKRLHHVKKHPSWPFSASILTKVAAPQILALLGTSWKPLADILSAAL